MSDPTSKTTEVALPWVVVERVLIGGNHLALIIGADHPPHTADHDTAREHYRIRRQDAGWDAYEAWCCWKTIMAMSQHLRSEGITS